ncbi:hypothetical protein GGF32_009248 [Allomyces javanicus]|nr:hypothetical protein GGF32_009248 [Allomyces javanicus]
MASPAPDASTVVPDYESMLILGRSDNSIFEAHDPPEPISVADDGLDAHPTTTMQADRAARSPQRLPATARASSPPAAGMMGGLPSNISLSWTDILRPLDQTSHQLVDQITAPPGLMTTLSATDMEGGNAAPAHAPAFVQQQQHSTASPAGVRPPSPPPLRVAIEQQQQNNAELNNSSNRAGRSKESTTTTTSARPASPTRAGSPGPQPVVLGALKGKIVASKVDTWRAPSPKRERKNGGSASPPASLGSAERADPQHVQLPASPPRRVQTADADQLAIAVASPGSARSLSSPPVPAASVFSGNQGSNVHLLQQSSFSAALQDMARQNAPSSGAPQSFEVTSPSKALSKLQQDQLQILLREAEANMQQQQQTAGTDWVKEVLPKVDTWRDERMSPTARRRAQIQQEQRELEHQRMLEAQAIERDRIWRAEQAAEQDRRRRDHENSIGIQACSLDFLVSVGAEPKAAAPVPQPQPMSPSAARRAAAAGGVQPKVDTWWREGVPRSRSPSFQERATNIPTRTESVPVGAITSYSAAEEGTAARLVSAVHFAPYDDEHTSSGIQTKSATDLAVQTFPSRTQQQYVQQHQHAHQPNQFPLATSPTAGARQGSPPGGRKTWAQTRTEPSPPPVRAASPAASMAAARPKSPTRTSQDSVPRAASPPVRPPSPSARSRMAQQALANQVTALHVATATPVSPTKDVPWENSLRFPPPSPTRARKTSAAQMDSAIVATPRSPAAASQMRVVTPSSPQRQQQMQMQAKLAPQQVQQQQQQLMVDTSMGGAGSQLSASSPAGSPSRSRKLYADVQAVVSTTRSRSGTGLSAAPVDEDGESLPKRAAIDSVFFAADGKANLVVRAKSVWSYLASDGVYVAVLLVFLVLVADLMTGSMAARHRTGCTQVARQLTNVGEVICDGQY